MFNQLDTFSVSHATYVNKEGDFGDKLVMPMAKDLCLNHWWIQHGGEFPWLQTVGMKVLAIIYAVGVCERYWSAYDFVYSEKRNRLTLERENL